MKNILGTFRSVCRQEKLVVLSCRHAVVCQARDRDQESLVCPWSLPGWLVMLAGGLHFPVLPFPTV